MHIFSICCLCFLHEAVKTRKQSDQSGLICQLWKGFFLVLMLSVSHSFGLNSNQSSSCTLVLTASSPLPVWKYFCLNMMLKCVLFTHKTSVFIFWLESFVSLCLRSWSWSRSWMRQRRRWHMEALWVRRGTPRSGSPAPRRDTPWAGTVLPSRVSSSTPSSPLWSQPLRTPPSR